MIADEVRAALERHARAEEPNEACGLLLLRGGTAERYVAARNAAASPYRFELAADPDALLAEDEGYELGVFHSHTASPARPSRADVENIGLWEGRAYMILSLRTSELAAFRITGGRALAEPVVTHAGAAS